MIETWLKVQLDAAKRKMETWPEWEKKELEAEIKRTPIRTADHDIGEAQPTSSTPTN